MARHTDDDLRTDDESVPVETSNGDSSPADDPSLTDPPAAAGDEPPDDGSDDDDELAEVPRRGRTALAISLVVALLLSGLVGVLATRGPAGGDDQPIDFSVAGDEAFDLSGSTLDGGDFDMGAYNDRWVVVNFFATWCVPCRREHPELVSFDEAHRQLDDAVLVSVLYDDDPDTAADFFERNGGSWPVVLDGDGAIAVGYGVTGVPETYLVQPDGLVLDRIVGGVTQDGLEAYMAEAEAALGEPGAGAGDGSGTGDRTGRGEGEEQP
jgi:cytochrome c biogenesis protein CcmG/thiol:disulfide interchange protein DsbE